MTAPATSSPVSSQGRTGRRLGKHGSDAVPGGGAKAAQYVGQSEQNAGGEKRADNPAGGHPRPSATCPCCGGPVDPQRIVVDAGLGIILASGRIVKVWPGAAAAVHALLQRPQSGATIEEIAKAIWGRSARPVDLVAGVRTNIHRARTGLRPLGFNITYDGHVYRIIPPGRS